MQAFLTRYQPVMLSILRIILALLFLEHGFMKLFQLPQPLRHVAYPLPPLLLAAGIIESIGGLQLLLGLFTRPVAFVTSGQMAFAYFIAHAPQSFWPAVNQGDAAILFCFCFLYLVFAGGGSISLDAFRARRKAGTAPATGSALLT